MFKNLADAIAATATYGWHSIVAQQTGRAVLTKAQFREWFVTWFGKPNAPPFF